VVRIGAATRALSVCSGPDALDCVEADLVARSIVEDRRLRRLLGGDPLRRFNLSPDRGRVPLPKGGRLPSGVGGHEPPVNRRRGRRRYVGAAVMAVAGAAPATVVTSVAGPAVVTSRLAPRPRGATAYREVRCPTREPYARKPARTVLGGREASNGLPLPAPKTRAFFTATTVDIRGARPPYYQSTNTVSFSCRSHAKAGSRP
jgi:hypothetical protein